MRRRWIFPVYVCVTSPGGCEAGHEADWTPLAGRSVTIWPDRKRPSGRKYAQTVTKILRGLRCDLALIDADAAASVAPNGTDRMPPDADQWDDAADALEEWPDREALRKAILQCAGPFSDVSDDEIDIEIEDEAEASAGKKSKWPPGFKMTSAGLKWTDPEKQSHVFVCGPIEVLAATCDPKNCGWGVLVRWKDPKGHVHEWAVPKSILGCDGAELRSVARRRAQSRREFEVAQSSCSISHQCPRRRVVRAVQSTGGTPMFLSFRTAPSAMPPASIQFCKPTSFSITISMSAARSRIGNKTSRVSQLVILASCSRSRWRSRRPSSGHAELRAAACILSGRARPAIQPRSLPRDLSGAAAMPVMSKHGAPQATGSRRPRRRIMMPCSVLMSSRKFPVRKRVRRPTCSLTKKASRDRREN